MEYQTAQQLIESAWDTRSTLTPQTADSQLRVAVDTVITGLESGQLRVAEPHDGEWVVNAWLKQAVMLYFRLYDNDVIAGQFTQFFDKVPLQYQNCSAADFSEKGVRVVPPATVRRGAFVGRNTILMPSYVNIGAYVGEGTMVDTWATVGSCAQIGHNVHLSGGVGIGGVLEPIQGTPTIIEDNCFIGARSEIVEGVVVERGAVISMGVFIGQSTRIYDRERGEILYGRVPSGAVVVPGTLPSSTGQCHLYAAIIVKRVDEQTREKVGLNALLRDALNE